jgi:hypothetical protein
VSAGEFQVQPSTFAPAASQLRQVAQQLVTMWEPVRQQTGEVKFGRGDDILSPLIQVSLEGATMLVDDCIQSSAEVLSAFGDGLEAMGANYQAAEQSADELMQSIGTEL